MCLQRNEFGNGAFNESLADWLAERKKNWLNKVFPARLLEKEKGVLFMKESITNSLTLSLQVD
jgi:hypothetical protein